MNAREHYQEAERLLAEASETLNDPKRAASTAGTSEWRQDLAHHLVARAQVHAALAAAAALGANRVTIQGVMYPNLNLKVTPG